MDRCLFALVNEGAQLLEEGIALRAVDIDIVYSERLWLPGLARRPDVLRRHGGAGPCSGAHPGI